MACIHARIPGIMKSTNVQTLGGNIGIFGLEIRLNAYVLGIYRTSFLRNLHCFIEACVHVVDDYSVINLYNHSIIIMYIYNARAWE